MRKFISVFVLISCFFLPGCSSIYSNFRELEQIRIIQTMGIDYIPGGVRITLSSDAEEDCEPLCISSSGSSISSALDKIKLCSAEQELFLPHISRIVIGEEAAKHGINGYLAFICRSPQLRIDTPLFVAKGRSAESVISLLNAGDRSVSDVLAAAEANAAFYSSRRLLAAAEVINSLSKYGGAPVCAIELVPSEEQSSQEKSGVQMTAVVSGFGVLNDSALCSYIDQKNAPAAALLLNMAGIYDITAEVPGSGPVTMEVSSGNCSINPVWSDSGSLSGIDIYAEVEASVLEMGDTASAGREELSDRLISQLESEVSGKIASVLQQSRKLQTDFLGLAGSLEMKDPAGFRAVKADFIQLLPSLELRVSVSGKLHCTKDLKDTQNGN